MNPHQLIGLVSPANNFAMGGLPMLLARVLLMEGQSLPKHLFLDIMVEKTQILINFIKNHHLGLCLRANIGGNTAVVWVYDNFATINTLQVTISNLPDLENQLFLLYTEIHGVVHEFLPEDNDDMPPLEDIMDNELLNISIVSYLLLCIIHIKYCSSKIKYKTTIITLI